VPPLDGEVSVLDPVDVDLPLAGHLDEATRRRLLGRYAADAADLLAAARPEELAPIPGTETLWAEVRWAARAEGVVHLDDLLLRRVRLGHLLPQGGEMLLPRLRAICQPELGWDDARWQAEESAYLDLWRAAYSLPDRALIPDWRGLLAQAAADRDSARPVRRRKVIKRSALAGGLAVLALILALAYRRWATA
jgi:glycerol-3-phosphate dehydrogenase